MKLLKAPEIGAKAWALMRVEMPRYYCVYFYDDGTKEDHVSKEYASYEIPMFIRDTKVVDAIRVAS